MHHNLHYNIIHNYSDNFLLDFLMELILLLKHKKILKKHQMNILLNIFLKIIYYRLNIHLYNYGIYFIYLFHYPSNNQFCISNNLFLGLYFSHNMLCNFLHLNIIHMVFCMLFNKIRFN